jgi:hypothetical protein
VTRRLDALSSDTIPVDASVRVQEPVWSPDGRMIAFTAWRSDGTSDVGIVPVEGGAPLLIQREGNEHPSDWW